MDLAEGEEAVAVAAILDKGGLERGFDPRHLRQIDVSLELLLVFGFEIEFLDPATPDDDDARLLLVGRVDQHFVCHERTPGRSHQVAARRHAPACRREGASPYRWNLALQRGRDSTAPDPL